VAYQRYAIVKHHPLKQPSQLLQARHRQRNDHRSRHRHDIERADTALAEGSHPVGRHGDDAEGERDSHSRGGDGVQQILHRIERCARLRGPGGERSRTQHQHAEEAVHDPADPAPAPRHRDGQPDDRATEGEKARPR
jgi:hypothetical protein